MTQVELTPSEITTTKSRMEITFLNCNLYEINAAATNDIRILFVAYIYILASRKNRSHNFLANNGQEIFNPWFFNRPSF